MLTLCSLQYLQCDHRWWQCFPTARWTYNARQGGDLENRLCHGDTLEVQHFSYVSPCQCTIRTSSKTLVDAFICGTHKCFPYSTRAGGTAFGFGLHPQCLLKRDGWHCCGHGRPVDLVLKVVVQVAIVVNLTKMNIVSFSLDIIFLRSKIMYFLSECVRCYSLLRAGWIICCSFLFPSYSSGGVLQVCKIYLLSIGIVEWTQIFC